MNILSAQDSACPAQERPSGGEQSAVRSWAGDLLGQHIYDIIIVSIICMD